MPVRRQTPTIAAPRLHTSFGNVRHDYGIEDSIQRADYLSNAVLEDTYEAATRSRGRDHELLRNVNAAIVSTEQHISPRAASVSRRVRASTVPPLSRPFSGQQVQQQKPYIKEGIYYRTPVMGTLQASRPPLPKPTNRKANRDVDGFTKPKNLLSWQYRVESRLTPDDIIYEPSSFIRMRERVKDVQKKMDRQRQLLDRYLDSDFKIQSSASQNVEGRSSVKIPAFYAAGGDPDNMPVSDLRRRLRRTLAKSKNSPDYFRD